MKKLLQTLFTKEACTAGFGIGKPNNLTAADNDADGIALFDLTLNNDAVLEGLPITEYSVDYFESESFARSYTNPLETPWKYYNITPQEEIVYVRVTSKANASEYAIGSFTITASAEKSEKNRYELIF